MAVNEISTDFPTGNQENFQLTPLTFSSPQEYVAFCGKGPGPAQTDRELGLPELILTDSRQAPSSSVFEQQRKNEIAMAAEPSQLPEPIEQNWGKAFEKSSTSGANSPEQQTYRRIPGPLLIFDEEKQAFIVQEQEHAKLFSEEVGEDKAYSHKAYAKMISDIKAALKNVPGARPSWTKELPSSANVEPTDWTQGLLNRLEVRSSDQKLSNELADRFGKDLDEKDRQELKEALTAAITGNVHKLAEMLPYADKGMSLAVQSAFSKSLESLGFTVRITGDALRCSDGYRHGEMIIAPPGSNEGIHLVYDRKPGQIVLPTYKVETVSDVQNIRHDGLMSFQCSGDDNYVAVDKAAMSISEALRKFEQR